MQSECTLKQLRHVSVLTVTSSSGSILLVFAKVTVVKLVNYGTSVCGDVAVYISRSLLVFVCTLHCSEVDKHE